MNKIKLSVLAIIACVSMFSLQANAQDKSISLGVKGGVNWSDVSGDASDIKAALKYQVGITVDVAITNHVYLQSGLELKFKELKSEAKGEDKVKATPMYLQVPLHLAYKVEIAPGARIFVNGGPYVAFGMGGKLKGEEKENIFGKDRFKRLDYGLGAGAGVEFGPLVVSGGYEWGLANVSDISNVKLRNRTIVANVGFKF